MGGPGSQWAQCNPDFDRILLHTMLCKLRKGAITSSGPVLLLFDIYEQHLLPQSHVTRLYCITCENDHTKLQSPWLYHTSKVSIHKLDDRIRSRSTWPWESVDYISVQKKWYTKHAHDLNNGLIRQYCSITRGLHSASQVISLRSMPPRIYMIGAEYCISKIPQRRPCLVVDFKPHKGFKWTFNIEYRVFRQWKVFGTSAPW